MTFRYKAIPRYEPWREGLTTSYASEMRKFVYLKQHAEPNAVKEHAELMAKLNLQSILDQASEGSVQTPTFEKFDQSEESNLLESRDNVEEDVKFYIIPAAKWLNMKIMKKLMSS
ncbi:hypothetical protein HS088_TW11G00457 [Tripterygium wilfordii]|uniref:Uncharacterized protein n=1 Tax=Tripterygium wilfordii TaxID=458696 RepID=A0A7J7D282_TRIWF|nr:hypothetical protein HS088_TW11G00457 [Tripterygium wilfordii]